MPAWPGCDAALVGGFARVVSLTTDGGPPNTRASKKEWSHEGRRFLFELFYMTCFYVLIDS